LKGRRKGSKSNAKEEKKKKRKLGQEPNCSPNFTRKDFELFLQKHN
jgi:hypothetical protein